MFCCSLNHNKLEKVESALYDYHSKNNKAVNVTLLIDECDFKHNTKSYKCLTEICNMGNYTLHLTCNE